VRPRRRLHLHAAVQLTGYPSVVVRAGVSRRTAARRTNVARPWCDHVALATARAIEQALEAGSARRRDGASILRARVLPPPLLGAFSMSASSRSLSGRPQRRIGFLQCFDHHRRQRNRITAVAGLADQVPLVSPSRGTRSGCRRSGSPHRRSRAWIADLPSFMSSRRIPNPSSRH
jgi:hypothetical protein